MPSLTAYKKKHIRFRAAGGLLNLRCLKAVTKVKETVVRELLFADDCALNTRAEDATGNIRLFKSLRQLRSHLSTKKTEVMYQPVPGLPYKDPHITVRVHNKLRAVDSFNYWSAYSQER